MCSKEQIYITKNGEVVAVLSNPKGDYYQTLNRLCGSLKNNNSEKDHDDMIGDEIMRRCGY